MDNLSKNNGLWPFSRVFIACFLSLSHNILKILKFGDSYVEDKIDHVSKYRIEILMDIFMPKRLTTDEFIIKAKHIHGDLYDYSNVIYINNKTAVSIIDPVYGEFKQTPDSHLKGCGNPKRGLLKCNVTSNTEEFIIKARNVHGDLYDYSKVNYVHSNIKVIIIDPIYGEFEQLPSGHLQGYGNPLRGKEKSKQWQYDNTRLSLNDFVSRCNVIHNNFYDYSKVQYVNSYTPIIVIDPEYGEFEIIPDRHLKGCKHPNRTRVSDEIDHIIPLSFICSAKERRYCSFQKNRPLFKFLNSDINLQIIDSKSNAKKNDFIEYENEIIRGKHYRNDYGLIFKIVLKYLNTDISDIIESDKEYVCHQN